MLALAALAATDGLRAATPSRIAASAGLPSSVFEATFGSTEACMLALYDDTVEALVATVDDAVLPCGPQRGRDAWRTQLDAGFSAVLQFLSALPDVTVACLVEAPALGGPVFARRERALQRFVDYAEHLRHSAAAGVTPLAVEMLVRGAYELILARASSGQTAELPALLNDLRTLWLGSYGPPDAGPRRFQREPRPG